MHFVVLVGIMLSAATAGGAQDTLDEAKNLYTAAAYEEALITLGHLRDTAAPDLKPEVEKYRAFCLYALGRAADAEAVAETLSRANPLVELDSRDASPRIQAMFAAVRKRVLMEAIRFEYRVGKAARDANRAIEAEAHLAAAQRMLDEARKAGAWDDSLADISVLVNGFLDLTRSQESRTSRPTVEAVEAPKEQQPPARPAAPAQGLRVNRTYDSSDADVVPPVVIRQAIPKPTQQLLESMRTTGYKSGVLDVLIGETGSVEALVMRESVNSRYDGVILTAARQWKYQPAMKDGTPVRYRKAITITIYDRTSTASAAQEPR